MGGKWNGGQRGSSQPRRGSNASACAKFAICILHFSPDHRLPVSHPGSYFAGQFPFVFVAARGVASHTTLKPTNGLRCQGDMTE